MATEDRLSVYATDLEFRAHRVGWRHIEREELYTGLKKFRAHRVGWRLFSDGDLDGPIGSSEPTVWDGDS